MYKVIYHRYAIYVIAAFFSLLLSFVIATQQVVINPDAICYLQSAQSMSMGLSYAMHLCGQAKWPFFSMLVFGFASVTKLSYLYSAYLLDALFSVVSVIAFISIIKFFNKTSRVAWLAALIILSAHEFNAVRAYIIRDHGFWAFYLLSILFLLHYCRQLQWRYAFAWSVSLVIAALFRIEGAIFLIALPFVVLLNDAVAFKARLRSFLRLNVITVLILVAFGTWVIAQPGSHHHFSRFDEIIFQFHHGAEVLINHFQIKAAILKEQFLNQYSARDVMVVLFFVLLAWYVMSVVTNLSVVYAILVIYAWYKKVMSSQKSDRLVLWGYIIVNVMITLVFLVEQMFLSKRYIVALSLVLMLWVPLALEELILEKSKRVWPLVLAILFIILSAVGGIFDFGYSKQYIYDAGAWLSNHASHDAKLYSNDYQVMYYSRHFGNDIFKKEEELSKQNILLNDQWKQYDYIALRLSKNALEDKKVVEHQLGKPMQIFQNKRGDAVVIYQIGSYQ